MARGDFATVAMRKCPFASARQLQAARHTPGHGGVLPRAKLTPEISTACNVELDRDNVSPARHSVFSSPLELMRFVDRLRVLSEGKPVGLKLAIGYRHEFMKIVKTMLETDIAPDFIVINGSEGGTGAAPVELTIHVGMLVADGLSFAHATLTGAGLRDRMSPAASDLEHPGDLHPNHIHVRINDRQIVRGEPRFVQMAQGTLLNRSVPDAYRPDWECAQAASFTVGPQ